MPRAPGRTQRRRPRRFAGRGRYVYRGRGKYNRAKADRYVKTGERIGRKIGKVLGGLGGHAFSHFFGRGSYHVVNNSLANVSPGNPDMPMIVNPGSQRPGSVLFRKSEYIADVISGSANTFDLNNYNVNPGLAQSFPWLSQVAHSFLEYEIIGMYFEYRSMSADALNSTNTALGQVIMAANYNAADPNFSSKAEMENFEGGISVKPSESVRYFLECSPRQNPISELYIRSGDIPSGTDIRLYDLANFQIATNGLQASNVVLGELWVNYEILLFKSRLYDTLGLDNGWAIADSTTYTSATPLRGFTAVSDSTIDMSYSDTVMTFPQESVVKSYYVYIYWFTNGVGVVVAFPTLTGSNCTVSSHSIPTNGDTAKGMTQSFIVVTDPNTVPTVTFGAAGTLPGVTGKIVVLEISNDLTGF